MSRLLSMPQQGGSAQPRLLTTSIMLFSPFKLSLQLASAESSIKTKVITIRLFEKGVRLLHSCFL